MDDEVQGVRVEERGAHGVLVEVESQGERTDEEGFHGVRAEDEVQGDPEGEEIHGEFMAEVTGWQPLFQSSQSG